MSHKRFDTGKTVVAVEEHCLQKSVIGDVQSVYHCHNEIVVFRLADRANRTFVIMNHDCRVIAYGI